MPLGDLGAAAYQLHLLSTMNPLPHLLERSLNAVGVSRPEMARQADRVGEATLILTADLVSNTREILSDALCGESVELGQTSTDRYRFPLWPEFEFEIEFQIVNGYHFTHGEFVRTLGTGPSDREPVPWGWLKGETLRRYEDVREIDLWSPYETYDALNPQDGKRCFLRFGWGVLQEIEPL
ncbi:hypothetical protein AB0M39_25575 [Streptomyces sp. NPDC051907]|uniref:hypothetical protein n=1 Tax=Streptomyces sp. NPDC051907 TaxID=3155284 RepID=UPI0034448211